MHFIIGPIYTLYSLQTGKHKGQQSHRGQQSQKKTWKGKPLVSASWRFFASNLCHPELSFLSWFLLGTTLKLVGKVTKGVWKGLTNPSLWEKSLRLLPKKNTVWDLIPPFPSMLCYKNERNLPSDKDWHQLGLLLFRPHFHLEFLVVFIKHVNRIAP